MAAGYTIAKSTGKAASDRDGYEGVRRRQWKHTHSCKRLVHGNSNTIPEFGPTHRPSFLEATAINGHHAPIWNLNAALCETFTLPALNAFQVADFAQNASKSFSLAPFISQQLTRTLLPPSSERNQRMRNPR
ncbi:hypothetical protein B0H16DRAFT_1462036 [Mycena metata]|uniref:Uncharacterized protein n=1 Tax=Mycena metata TaxID=1033252 RepID=A0AAD7IP76_9AGAR|nr:hypothetical protein B0H16DRAFT_1462036 [Mycena metata]